MNGNRERDPFVERPLRLGFWNFGRDELSQHRKPFPRKGPKRICLFFLKNHFKGCFLFFFVKKVKVNLLRYFSYDFFEAKVSERCLKVRQIALVLRKLHFSEAFRNFRFSQSRKGPKKEIGHKIGNLKTLIRNGPKNLKSHGGFYYF